MEIQLFWFPAALCWAYPSLLSLSLPLSYFSRGIEGILPFLSISPRPPRKFNSSDSLEMSIHLPSASLPVFSLSRASREIHQFSLLSLSLKMLVSLTLQDQAIWTTIPFPQHRRRAYRGQGSPFLLLGGSLWRGRIVQSSISKFSSVPVGPSIWVKWIVLVLRADQTNWFEKERERERRANRQLTWERRGGFATASLAPYPGAAHVGSTRGCYRRNAPTWT